MLEADDLGGGLEVGVVVHEGEPVFGCEYRGEQVGDADGAVPDCAGQFPLRGEGLLPVLVIGGQVFVGLGAVGADRSYSAGLRAL